MEALGTPLELALNLCSIAFPEIYKYLRSGLMSSGDFSTWVDGQPLTYTSWADSEPTAQTGDRCVSISRDDDFKWVTGLCDFAQQFVCREPGNY